MVEITIAPLLKAECESRTHAHVAGPPCLWGHTSGPGAPNVMAELHDAVLAVSKHTSNNPGHRVRYTIHLAYLLIGQPIPDAKRVLLWRSPLIMPGGSGVMVEQLLIDHLIDMDVTDAHGAQLLREEAHVWRVMLDKKWQPR